jgi:hypothetical protein
MVSSNAKWRSDASATFRPMSTMTHQPAHAGSGRRTSISSFRRRDNRLSVSHKATQRLIGFISLRKRRKIEQPDCRHLWLLCARRERPCCGTAEQSNKLAPLQLIELHAATARLNRVQDCQFRDWLVARRERQWNVPLLTWRLRKRKTSLSPQGGRSYHRRLQDSTRRPSTSFSRRYEPYYFLLPLRQQGIARGLFTQSGNRLDAMPSLRPKRQSTLWCPPS